MADVVTLLPGDVVVVNAAHLVDVDGHRLGVIAEMLAEALPENRVVLVRCTDPLGVASVPGLPPLLNGSADAGGV